MDCIEMTLDLGAVGAGNLSPQGCSRAAAHLSECEDCQQLLAFFVTSWEHEYEIPPAPTAIERWRSVAKNVSANLAPLLRGTHDRSELELLAAAARASWSLGAQERTLYEWFQAVNRRAEAVGGFGPEFGE